MNHSLKKNNHTDAALPPELSAAIAQAEAVLANHEKLAAVLAETAAAIPLALAEERKSYVAETDDGRRRFADARERHAEAARRRAVTCEGLLNLSDDLNRARGEVRQSQSAFAGTLISEFHARWQRTCQELAKLQGEARQLAAILHTMVPTPPPFVASLNAVSGQPELRFVGELIQPEALPPALSAMGNVLDRLDSAAGLVAALKQAAELNAKHYALARVRTGMPSRLEGPFEVVRRFDMFGSNFEAGMLLDRTPLCDGLLHRFWVGRNIRPLEGSTIPEVA